MSLLAHINGVLQNVITGAGKLWHEKISPWLNDFLSATVHAEVDAIIPIARDYVAQAVPALVKAAASGDFEGFADAQWDAVVATAEQAQKEAIHVAITSVSTAVNSLIVAHPDVIAATQPAGVVIGAAASIGLAGQAGGDGIGDPGAHA